MPKKIALFFIACCLGWCCSACAAQLVDGEEPAVPQTGAGAEAGGETSEAGNAPEGRAELALVLNDVRFDDYSYNQTAWEALKRVAADREVSCGYYLPKENSPEAYLEAIGRAAAGGARLIVCAGPAMEAPVYEAQYQHPGIKFLLIDGEPHSADFSTYAVGDNTCAVYFAEQQAGFLAGYAAVKNGYTLLGFLGGMPVPPVIRYGYGFIYGARYAAGEDNKTGIEIVYHYSGSNHTTEDAQTLAGEWYNNGAQLIFSCHSGDSAVLAAEAADGEVIGVDIDQSNVSETVAASALKIPAAAVNLALKGYFADSFPGGRILTLGAADNAVGLSVDNLRFTDFGVDFTSEIYTTIFTKLMLGDIIPPVDTDYASARELSSERVQVTLVE